MYSATCRAGGDREGQQTRGVGVGGRVHGPGPGSGLGARAGPFDRDEEQRLLMPGWEWWEWERWWRWWQEERRASAAGHDGRPLLGRVVRQFPTGDPGWTWGRHLRQGEGSAEAVRGRGSDDSWRALGVVSRYWAGVCVEEASGRIGDFGLVEEIQAKWRCLGVPGGGLEFSSVFGSVASGCLAVVASGVCVPPGT